METNGTPSPQIKETGSNKRIMTEQGGPSTSRPQPDAQSPQGQSSEAHGQDGITATNTATPNNNPANTVIPTEASNNNQLHEHLTKLRILETKYAKVDHHITFLSEALTHELIPPGLAWDITVNVMEANTTINEKIQTHIKESVMKLMEIMREHYDTVVTEYTNQMETTQNTIDNIKTPDNEAIIHKAKTDRLQQTEELTNKLKLKRTRKLNNFKSPRQRRPPRFAVASNTQHLNYPAGRQQPFYPQPTYQQPTHQYQDPRPPPPRPLFPPDQDPFPRDPRIRRYTPPPQPPPPAPRPENNVGVIVNTFGTFLTNLQQQTTHLLQSLNLLTSTQTRF